MASRIEGYGLIGTPGHGCWIVAPVDATERATRRNHGNTLILEAQFKTKQRGSSRGFYPVA